MEKSGLRFWKKWIRKILGIPKPKLSDFFAEITAYIVFVAVNWYYSCVHYDTGISLERHYFMKLPAESCGFSERNCAVAIPRQRNWD